MLLFFFFFKQKTAYEMRISDWSSDVCSSDLSAGGRTARAVLDAVARALAMPKEEWPTLPDLNDSPQGRQPVADLLRVLLKIKCEEHDVAPKLVASSEIGRASCRERVCQYVSRSVGAVSLKKKQNRNHR